MNTCKQCGQPMASNAPEGLCARCLLSAAVKTDAPEPVTRLTPAPDFPDIGDMAEVARRLPQFEIISLLGRGGMGVVYQARQLHLDRIVALKILPPADAQSPDFVERFRREARSLAKLSHPNIVAVHEFGESGGLYYFVMEFIDGVNLRDMIRGGSGASPLHAAKSGGGAASTFTPAEALAVVPKICDALQFAHEEGVVHRDIKPENILIDKRGRVKIADFGLAKLLRRDQTDHTLTHSGMMLGTPRYMAPEQLDKPESVDHRADIYSLGVVFYEMLTGEVPMGRFAPPSERVQVDVRLDEIVLRSLERDVERRYQHASEVKTDIENVKQASPPARPAAPRTTVEPPLLAQINARGIEMIIAGIAVGLSGLIAFIYGAVVAFYFANQSGNPGDAAARAAGGAFMMLTQALCGIAVLVGGISVRKVRFHSYALAMSVLLIALLPMTLLVMGRMNQVEWVFFQNAFALYVGIRALRMLRRAAVKAAFGVAPGNTAASIAVPPAVQPQTRHLLSAFLCLLMIFGFWFGVSFHAKSSADSAGISKIITVGALDPFYVSEGGPRGFHSGFNFFSWSFFALLVAGVAFSALLRVGREDQGKVSRDPAWWRAWWTQVGLWGGLVLIVCIVRTVRHPEQVLRSPGERTVNSRFTQLFSSGPEFREDRSRVPTTRTPGRTDYAYAFTVPANHRLFVWLEWWKNGKRTIDQNCNTGYVANPGQRYDAGVQIVFTDGNVAGPTTAGQTRIDWIFYDPTGHSTSGKWRPEVFAGMTTTTSWGEKSSWTPKVGETVTLLAIGAGKDSVMNGPFTDERLRAGHWQAAMLLKARVEPVPASQMSVAPFTKMNAWNDNEDPSPALLRLGEQFGAVTGPFATAANHREQIAFNIKKDAAARAKAEQMLRDAGAPASPNAKPEDLVKALENSP